MQKRPILITIVAWLFIITAGISAITTTAMSNHPMVLEAMSKNPLPFPVQWAMAYAGMLIMIVSGFAFLKGRNWARYLYLIWSLAGFAIGFAISPMKMTMVPGFVFFVVVVTLLFLPRSNAYFSQPKADNDAQAV